MDKQRKPKGDLRYRTHRSVKLYVARMHCGTKWCTWFFNNSIERVVYRFPDNSQRVVLDNKFFILKSPEEMRALVNQHLDDSGTVHIGGRCFEGEEDKNLFEPFHFIDLTDTETWEEYKTLREPWLIENSR